MNSPKTNQPDLRNQSLKERFFYYVQKDGDCWIWTGLTTNDPPVPTICFKGANLPARRLSLKYAGCETTQRISNKCGNPLCVNPEHLSYIEENKYQQIVALKQSGEYSTQEIAALVSLPVDTVQHELLEYRRKDLNPENVLAGRIRGEVPGYFMLGEACKLTGLQADQMKKVARMNGWETYRIGVTVFFRAEHIESLLNNDEAN